MKFEVINGWTNQVQFTADIECDTHATLSLKRGLAVKWAIKNKVSLNGAELIRADLSHDNLNHANLNGAELFGANLFFAKLFCAELNKTDLSGANLRGADLSGADLGGANLSGANLNGANFYDANLDGADLHGVYGNNIWVKCIQCIDQYSIAYTHSHMQIGRARHAISDWAQFDDEQIEKMDGENVLAFWHKYKDLIFQTIDLCPAKQTKQQAAWRKDQ